MRSFVIDSWPVLEWLQDKAPVAQAFEEFLGRCFADGSLLYMSRINYGEIVYTLAKRFPEVEVADCLQRLSVLPIQILSVDDELIDAAVALKSRYAFSYADAFAAAQARRSGSTVVTGDREFRELSDDGLIQLEWLGA